MSKFLENLKRIIPGRTDNDSLLIILMLSVAAVSLLVAVFVMVT